MAGGHQGFCPPVTVVEKTNLCGGVHPPGGPPALQGVAADATEGATERLLCPKC